MAWRVALISGIVFTLANSQSIKVGKPVGVSVSLNEPTTNEARLASAVQELALSISAIEYERGQNENVVQSPLSIAALLSLLLLASRGESHFELKKGLAYPDDISDTVVHSTFQKILDSLDQKKEGVDVSFSTRLFLQEKLNVLGQFTQIADRDYHSGVQPLDFAGAPDKAKNHINDWVSRATRGKITDLITSPFSPETKFVVANVIYFNGEWEYPFSERFTEDGTFDTGSKNISIPMMTNLLTIPFIKAPDFDMISLPYKGNKYSMYILTPHGNPGIRILRRLEFSLDSKVLSEFINLMEPKKVAVKIPRMKLKQKLNLKDDLKTIGISQIFNPYKADFGRLTTEPGIYISDIVHEAVLEVTETGTVAAAASSATFDRMGGNEVFQLNRPSLLFIRDNTNGLTLFWARLVQPEPLLT